jgi:hypothetical protein
MRLFAFCLFYITVNFAMAQTFTEYLPILPLEGLTYSSIAFTDVDGDQDQDLLVAGRNSSGDEITNLFINNGIGNYIKAVETPFEGVAYGSIAVADIDGDMDQDVLISGENSSGLRKTRLYINNGIGEYSEVEDTIFEGVALGTNSFVDIDGDMDQDILITGQNDNGKKISILYTNNGYGEYEEIATPFEEVKYGAIAFADVDGDTDQDLFITGRNGIHMPIAKLYINDGLGGYSESDSSIAFHGVEEGSIAVADIDGDSDQDVLISGENHLGVATTKLYTNDGNGNYSEVNNTVFEGVNNSSTVFIDIDGDTDLDIILSGADNEGERITRVYINDGTGSYEDIYDSPFVGMAYGAIGIADIDADNDQDILISGSTDMGRRTILYINDGLGNFMEAVENPFDEVSFSAIDFADVDGDGDKDILMAGSSINSMFESISILYINDGVGNYSENTDTPFMDLRAGSANFVDLDGDEDQDVFITGLNSSNVRRSRLYLNDGIGNYSILANTGLANFGGSSVTFADVDGDTDQDLFITGRITNLGESWFAKLYYNNGLVNSTNLIKKQSNIHFVVYPNPIQNKLVNVDINIENSSEIQISLFNMLETEKL